MPLCIDVECFRHWAHDESYWEMNESLRYYPDNKTLVFKSKHRSPLTFGFEGNT